jgi:hypothetical protein
MPTLGLVSITYRKLTPAEIIPLVRDAGLSCIEWGSDIHVPQTDLANARRVGEMTREAGLTVSSYGSYYRLGAGQDFAPYLAAPRRLPRGNRREPLFCILPKSLGPRRRKEYKLTVFVNEISKRGENS